MKRSKSNAASGHDKKARHQKMGVDLQVHRMRHLHYQPGGVTSMAADSSRLAVARETGHVQLYRMDPKLRHVSTIAGYKDRPLTSMVWIKDSLLLVAACQSDLLHVDFSSHSLRTVTPSGGGGVFDLELIRQGDQDVTVAAACEDGSIRIFGGTDLQLLTTYPTANSPILSLAYAWDDQYLYAGVADGTIRCYNRDQRCVNRMTMESRGRGVATKVWALATARDGTVVSADSLGQVQVWDGRTGTWVASMPQNDNQADVLTLLMVDENKFFCGGVDPHVVCVEKSSKGEWAITNSMWCHSHDVRAMACLHGQHLVTAGVDTKLAVAPVDQNKRTRSSYIYPWPTVSPVAVGGRRLAMLRSECVDIHEFAPKTPDDHTTYPLICKPDTLLGTIQLNESFWNARSCAVSPDGKLVAIASDSLFLFDLDNMGVDFQPTRIKVQPDKKLNCITAMKFFSEKSLILATGDNVLVLVSVEDGETVVTGTAQHAESKNSHPIHVIEVCKSANLFATLSHGKEGSIQVYKVNSNNDIDRLWTSPYTGIKASATSIIHSVQAKKLQLVVACVDFSMYVFDIEKRQLSPWSEKAGVPMKMPIEVSSRKDVPICIRAHPTDVSLVLLISTSAIVAVRLERPHPTRCQLVPENETKALEKKKTKGVACTLCRSYKDILQIDFLNGSEMVVVEQPWLDVEATLPDALQRHVYGT